MDALRRTLLKAAGASSALAAAIAAGVLRPVQALAVEFERTVFQIRDFAGALKGAGASGAAPSKDITLKAPDIAENGAVVPIEIASTIPNAQSISLFIEKNPFPLTTHFEFSNGALPQVSVRVKMAETSKVHAVVKAGGKAYVTAADIKVTTGGCG